MPYLLSKAEQDNFLKRFRLGESKTSDIAYKAAKVIKTDVLIAGSGPIGYVPYSSLIVLNSNSLSSV